MIQAARYWGVPPWQLMRESRYWVSVAEHLSQAEEHFQSYKSRKESKARTRASRRPR